VIHLPRPRGFLLGLGRMMGGRPKRQAAGWAPPQAASLQAWGDASELPTTDPLDTWSDKHTSAHDFTQDGQASFHPRYNTNQQNGLPGITFDGTAFVKNAALAGLVNGKTNPAFTVIAAISVPAFSAEQKIFAFSPETNDMPLFTYFLSNGTGYPGYYCSAGSTAYEVATTGPSAGAMIAEFVCAGTTAKFLVNGVAHLDGSGHMVGAVSGVASMQLGSCKRESTTGGLLGNIYEFLIYDSALSDADRLNIRTQLSTKWGISL